MAAKMPSKLIIRVAIIGSQCFCPIIEKVYATPEARIPEYSILGNARVIFALSNGVSLNINANRKPKIPTTTNLKNENLSGSIFLIYLGTWIIVIEYKIVEMKT